MVSSEVQRTLVKSPPELWAELSDPASLARHLGELGEIRITRVEPETKVEWETHDTTGSVLIDPSGWGTKVTLTARRTFGGGGGGDVASELSLGPNVSAATQEPAPDESPRGAAGAAVTESSELAAPLVSRRGLLARLLGRRRRVGLSRAHVPGRRRIERSDDPFESSAEPADAFAAVTKALVPETFAASHPFAGGHGGRLPAAEPAEPTEPTQADARRSIRSQQDTEQVTAVLTSALDRLGSAHHRPFSRA